MTTERKAFDLMQRPDVRKLLKLYPTQPASGFGEQGADARAIGEFWSSPIQKLARILERPGVVNARDGITQGVAIGAPPTLVGDDFIALVSQNAAHSTLNVQIVDGPKTSIPIVTGTPSGALEAPWLKFAAQGAQMSPVATVLGGGATTELRENPILIEVSNALDEDAGPLWGRIARDRLANGHRNSLDLACVKSDGTDDATNGGFTGLFGSAEITAVEAAATRTRLALLEEEDLLRTMDAVAPAALERGCRWWMNSAVYLQLLRMKTSGGVRLVEFGAGVPTLFGSPITITAAAPSTDSAGEKVLCFGCGAGYLVAIHRNISLLVTEAPRFDFNNRLYRSVLRAYCGLLDATWFATLKLASE